MTAPPLRRTPTRSVIRRCAFGLTIALTGASVLGACGSTSSSSAAAPSVSTAAGASASAPPSDPGAANAAPANPLPVMNVTDVKTGQPVALASFLDGSKPLLVWFWAPH
jgi:hypothetical protein